MLLPILIFIPFIGGILCLFFNQKNIKIPHYIAIFSISLELLLLLILLINSLYKISIYSGNTHWIFEYNTPWISNFGINFHLAVDGLSLLMLNLTGILGFMSILFSWKKIVKHVGLFYLNLLWILGSVVGVFLSVDLFVFFFFWELSIVPTYFLILIWGYKNSFKSMYLKRKFIANKFFIYSQLSGLILIFSILSLVYAHYYYDIDHIITFDYEILCHTTMNIVLESFIMLGFFLAFAIKIPIVPLHGWLPNFHAYSPITGSVDLSGILLKTGIYALIRFNFTLFPHSSIIFSPIMIWLGTITVFYGAITAFLQKNIKKLIAYTSISHMGLVIIAMYSTNELAYYGAIIQIISFCLSTSALFLLSGQLFQYTNTFNMNKMGGLWNNLKWIPGLFLFFSIVNLGIPGTGNFIGEFMILISCFCSQPILVGLLTFSLIFSALYSLTMVQKIYFGPINKNFDSTWIDKITIYEIYAYILLLVLILFIGFYPKLILDILHDSLHNIYIICSNFIKLKDYNL